MDSAKARETGSQPKLIGVVDDDPSIRKSLKRLLETAGYSAHTFDSGEALLAYAGLESFDVLIVDVILGGLSGIEVLEELEASGIHKPALLITAHSEDEIPGQSSVSQQTPILRKPFGAKSLLGALAGLASDRAAGG